MSLQQSNRNLALGSWSRTRFRSVDLFAKIPPFAWLLLIMLALSVFGEEGYFGLIRWAILFVWAMSGPGQAVEALLASMLLVHLNPAVFISAELTLSLRWAVLLVAGARVAVAWAQTRFWRPKWASVYLLFVAYLFLISLWQSQIPALSVSKLLAYALMSLAIYLGIALGDRDWSANLIAFGLILVFFSLPLLAFPAGYLVNGYQFQGILNHPQSFGVVLAIPVAYMLAHWTLSRNSKLSLFRIVVLILSAFLLIQSGARSGYLAVLLGSFITLMLGNRERSKSLIMKALFHPFTYFLLAGVIVFLGSTADFSSRIESFFLERDASAYAPYGIWLEENSNPIQRIFASRQHLATASWENFLTHPWFGIGFGVPSDQIMPSSLPRIGPLIISAPVEKGFLVSAVLEEVGLLGFVLFLVLTITQLRLIANTQESALLCLAMVALSASIGEFIYFAAGSGGILVQIGIGIGLAASEPTPSPTPLRKQKSVV